MQGRVLAGGSSQIVNAMLESKGNVYKFRVTSHGKDVLYVGDSIFGDVLKSKKNRGWKFV